MLLLHQRHLPWAVLATIEPVPCKSAAPIDLHAGQFYHLGTAFRPDPDPLDASALWQRVEQLL
jgi:hypothetical protein